MQRLSKVESGLEPQRQCWGMMLGPSLPAPPSSQQPREEQGESGPRGAHTKEKTFWSAAPAHLPAHLETHLQQKSCSGEVRSGQGPQVAPYSQ